MLVPRALIRAVGGDYLAAAALRRICELWGLESEEGYVVERDGEHWIALGAPFLAADLRVSAEQAKRALRVLTERGLIIKGGPWKDKGTPKNHYRPNPEALKEAYRPVARGLDAMTALHDLEAQVRSALAEGWSFEEVMAVVGRGIAEGRAAGPFPPMPEDDR